MNTRIIITSTIALLLLQPVALCQQNGPAENGAAAQPLPADVILGHGYVRRDGAIHFIGGGVTGTGANATRIDMPSPELLKKVVDSKYGPFKTAEGLDVASFEALSEEYTRDKERVYFKVISPGEFIVVVLPEADPATFEVLASHIAKDKNHVWYYDRIQSGADPATVELVDEGWGVYKDKHGIYLNKLPFPRSKSGPVTWIDDGMLKAGDLVFVVDIYHYVPVTVFKEDGKLMAETYSYDPTSREPQCMITAEVTPKGLENIRTGPLPGRTEFPAVPDWRLQVFERPDLVQRIIEAGKRIK